MDDDGGGNLYYESLSLPQAAHPQAILAYDLNDKPVPIANGAPIRLKVPTQLGYKSAKYVQAIEIVPALGGDLGDGAGRQGRECCALHAVAPGSRISCGSIVFGIALYSAEA